MSNGFKLICRQCKNPLCLINPNLNWVQISQGIVMHSGVMVERDDGDIFDEALVHSDGSVEFINHEPEPESISLTIPTPAFNEEKFNDEFKKTEIYQEYARMYGEENAERYLKFLNDRKTKPFRNLSEIGELNADNS